MHLDDREIDLLARFFAKRFPTLEERAPLLIAAELESSASEQPIEAWREVLERAQRQGALKRLALAARSDDPDDTNLREVRRLLVGAPPPRWNLIAAGLGAVAGLALVAVGGGVWAVVNLATGGSDPVEPRSAKITSASVLVEAREPDTLPVTARTERPPTP